MIAFGSEHDLDGRRGDPQRGPSCVLGGVSVGIRGGPVDVAGPNQRSRTINPRCVARAYLAEANGAVAIDRSVQGHVVAVRSNIETLTLFCFDPKRLRDHGVGARRERHLAFDGFGDELEIDTNSRLAFGLRHDLAGDRPKPEWRRQTRAPPPFEPEGTN